MTPEEERFLAARNIENTPRFVRNDSLNGKLLGDLEFAYGDMAGRLADDQLRLDCNFSVGFLGAVDAGEKSFGSDAAHFFQWLADCGERRNAKSSAEDVIKADNRDFLRNAKAGFLKSAHGANGGNVVVGEKGGEGNFACEEFFGERIAEFGSGIDSRELNDAIGIDGDAEFAGNLANRREAYFGIRAFRLAFEKRDFAVAEILQVF
jgi:hypothetical protein